jgi:4-cresol dehydrogenase (hydroxylating)
VCSDLALASALEAWVAVLGAGAVDTTERTLGRYARSASSLELRPSAVLYPRSTGEVQRIVEIASRERIPLHAISRGMNWGYGDACAPTPGQVIVDLSRMNRIIEVNEEIGFARIEAGVSQGELYGYLRDHGLPLWMDATAAGPDASVVGNTLDRGHGHTRYGDRSLATCGMTVVLPDGSLLKTGFSHFENAKAAGVYRNGVGPFVDGLFFQSNLGIVTEMGIWLMPRPEHFSAFFISTDDDQALGEIIDRLGPLKRQGLLPSTIHIANDLRLIANRTRYPWEEAGGVTPLPRDLRLKLRRRYGVGAWIGCGSITGPATVVRAIEKRLKRELRGFKPVFLNDRKLRLANRLADLLDGIGAGRSLREKINTVTPVLDLLKGVPTAGTLQGAEWRVRGATTGNGEDILESNAGFTWISPVLPMTAAATREVLQIMETTYARYGFDTLVTFTMITDRALCAVSNVAYDRSDAGDVARAKDCYADLYTRLMDAGYIPYRTGPSGFAKLNGVPSTFWNFASSLKSALDPNEILSPGRYIPRG